MAAYIIADIDVTDPEGYAEYRKLSTSAVEKYGGKFLVRGGQTEVLEGSWQPRRLIVTEFESLEQAQRWYDSEEYAAAKTIRFRTADSNLLLVEGA